ncbi:hypothetical protein LXL04_007734 [Taraxacum kok-saghyz]
MDRMERGIEMSPVRKSHDRSTQESASVVSDWIGKMKRSWKVKGTAVFPFQSLILTGSGLNPSSLRRLLNCMGNILISECKKR